MKRVLLASVMGLVIFSTTALDSAEASTYKVQAGDNLYRISQKYQVSINDIKKWNSLTSDSIYVNQNLKVSAGQKTTTPAPAQASKPQAAKPITSAPPAKAVNAGSGIHRVQKGDSLYAISKKYGVTVAQLTSWNKLTSTTIFVNQALKISNGPAVKQAAAPRPAAAKKEIAKPVTAVPVTNAASPLYETAVKTAFSLAGTPYAFGGISPAGFDCSGFIYYVYSQAGIPIYRNSSLGYFGQSSEVTNPVFGDFIFFENTYKPGISHMGIFIGNNSFIHAGSKGVEISRLDNPYWQQHFAGFKRLNTVTSVK